MRLLLPEPGPLPPGGLLALYEPPPGPSLRLGFVVSADGRSSVEGSSRPLQTETDAAALRTLRALGDVVLVGAGTARGEDYGPVRHRAEASAWRRETGRAPEARLAVVSRRLDLDPASRLFSGPPPVVLTCAASPPERRAALAAVAEVVVVGEEEVDLPSALAAVRERGGPRVLCEGGPRLAGALLARGLVDEVCTSVVPLLAGAGPGLAADALVPPHPLRLAHLVAGEDGTLLQRWQVQGRGGEPRGGQDDGAAG